jgi:hypothetical protein
VNEQEFAELAAGHALHALSPGDEAAFEAARRQHPEWEHHVTTDAETAVLLADGIADVTPPPALRGALLAQIAGGSTASASGDAGSPNRRRARSAAGVRVPGSRSRLRSRCWSASGGEPCSSASA